MMREKLTGRVVKVDVGTYRPMIQRLSGSEVVLHRHFGVVDVALHQFAENRQLSTALYRKPLFLSLISSHPTSFHLK